MSVSLATLLADLIEENSLGRVGAASANGSTSAIIDVPNFGSGTMAASEWARGSPIRITSGARVGSKTFVSVYNPTTGTLTPDPVLSGALTTNDTFVVVHKYVTDSVDRLIEAINRGLRRHCDRCMKVPLTAVIGGDLLGAASNFSGSSATITYVDQAVTDNAYFQRYAHVLLTGNNGYAEPSSNVFVTPGDVISFAVPIRKSATAGGSPTITVQDVSNGAPITPVYSSGAATTASLTWLDCQGTFTVPANCFRISFRIGTTANATAVDFGPLIVQSQLTKRFVTQSHLDAIPGYVGNFFTAPEPGGLAQPNERSFQPLAIRADVEDLGNGVMSLVFDQPPPFPLYYEENFSYDALTTDAGTTACPEDLALAAAAYELFRTLDMQERRTNQNLIVRGRRVSVSRWESDLQRAEQELAVARKAWGAERKLVIRRAYGAGAYA